MTDLSYAACDEYMASRTGKYEWRAIRYRKAAQFFHSISLSDEDTVCDLGAGWTEFDYCLRTEFDWRGRYMPLDAGMYPVDLNSWTPNRPVEFFVALEIVEHLHDPERILRLLPEYAHKGIAISVPNPRTVDVYGMDPTHVSAPTEEMFRDFGYTVQEATFYGGVYSQGAKNDALFATWSAPRNTSYSVLY